MGLPRARSARVGQSPVLIEYGQPFGCHVTNRAYVRTYSPTDCTGGVGETIKRTGGVSQVYLRKSISFTLDIHNIVN